MWMESPGTELLSGGQSHLLLCAVGWEEQWKSGWAGVWGGWEHDVMGYPGIFTLVK